MSSSSRKTSAKVYSWPRKVRRPAAGLARPRSIMSMCQIHCRPKFRTSQCSLCQIGSLRRFANEFKEEMLPNDWLAYREKMKKYEEKYALEEKTARDTGYDEHLPYSVRRIIASSRDQDERPLSSVISDIRAEQRSIDGYKY